jgi:hypothetical protein
VAQARQLIKSYLLQQLPAELVASYERSITPSANLTEQGE